MASFKAVVRGERKDGFMPIDASEDTRVIKNAKMVTRKELTIK